MEKLLNLIEEKVNFCDSSVQEVNNAIEIILMDQHFLKSMFYQPDTINTMELRKEVSDDLLDMVSYVEKIKGWFSKCPNESQIKVGLKYLKKIINHILQKYSRKIILLNKLRLKFATLREKYINLYDKLLEYSDNTYIKEEEFELIEQLCTDDNINEDILLSLCKIGRTNALIKLDTKKFVGEYESDLEMNELFEKMEEGRGTSENNSKKLLTKIKNELSNKYMLEITLNDITLVEKVTDIFNFVLNLGEITIDMYEEAEIFKSEIELISDKQIYVLASAMLILDALDKKDKIEIKKIIEKYTQKEKNNQKNLLSDKVLKHKREQLSKIIDEYYVEDEFLNFSSSCRNMSEDEIIKLYGFEKFYSMKIMNLIHLKYSKLNSMSLLELDELINNLNFHIAYYREIQKKIDEEEVKELDGADISDVLNYVVFLSKDRILKNISNIVDEYTGVNLSLFPSSLCKLMMIPHSELYSRKTCKPIMRCIGKTNEYEIREERAGSIRICFKAINTKDGHVVYEVLSFAYGSCGDKKKDENLKYALKEYEEHYEEYQNFERMIKNSTIAEISNIITDGLTVYNMMITQDKNKKVGDNI